MLGVQMAIKSAENFRALRKKGITVRKTADVITSNYRNILYRTETSTFIFRQRLQVLCQTSRFN